MNELHASALLGTLAAAALAVLLYLCAPSQCWRPRTLTGRAGLVGGGLLGTAAVVLFRRVLGPAEAVYATLLVVMIVLGALPFVTAAFTRGRPVP